MTGSAIIVTMSPDDELRLAQARPRDVIAHVRLLAADADTQDAWLHPCGWTRQEPYQHANDHGPCASISELVISFDDMWPAWRPILAVALSRGGEAALDQLRARLQQLDDDSFRDAIDTLDREQWMNCIEWRAKL
jgi:hypothetical protein